MFEMSATTQKIFAAVAKMQAELTNASKDKQAYGYKYADLAECLSTAKEPLSKNGLAVVQLMGMTENCESTLITMLTHETGEFIRSETIIPKANLSGSGKGNAVQEMGAAITYMRRYAFAAIIGMTQEDTDAAQPPKQQPKPPPPIDFNIEEACGNLRLCKTLDQLQTVFTKLAPLAQKAGYSAELISVKDEMKTKLSGDKPKGEW